MRAPRIDLASSRSPLQTDSVADGLPGFGVSGGLRERNRLRLREAMRGANGTVFVCGLPLRGDASLVTSVIARRMPEANRLRFRLALLGEIKPSALAMPALRTVRVGVGRCGPLTRPLAAYVGRPRQRWARWRRRAAGVVVLIRRVTKLNRYRLLGAAVCGI